jgi:hypothetical protein
VVLAGRAFLSNSQPDFVAISMPNGSYSLAEAARKRVTLRLACESERRKLGAMTQFEQSVKGWEFILSPIAVLIGGSLLVSLVTLGNQ